jgi:hypothetical protein
MFDWRRMEIRWIIEVPPSSFVLGNEENGNLPFLQHGKVLLRYPLGKIIMEKCEEGCEEMKKHSKAPLALQPRFARGLFHAFHDFRKVVFHEFPLGIMFSVAIPLKLRLEKRGLRLLFCPSSTTIL